MNCPNVPLFSTDVYVRPVATSDEFAAVLIRIAPPVPDLLNSVGRMLSSTSTSPARIVRGSAVTGVPNPVKPLPGWNVRLIGTSVSPPLYRRRRSEEHTSELQSRLHLVCRLLLEKKKSRTRPSPC